MRFIYLEIFGKFLKNIPAFLLPLFAIPVQSEVMSHLFQQSMQNQERQSLG